VCDEYSPATVYCSTLYMYSLLIPIRDFPSDGRTTWVRAIFIKVLMHIVPLVPPGTYRYAQNEPRRDSPC
jgi:hypothetical protein